MRLAVRQAVLLPCCAHAACAHLIALRDALGAMASYETPPLHAVVSHHVVGDGVEGQLGRAYTVAASAGHDHHMSILGVGDASTAACAVYVRVPLAWAELVQTGAFDGQGDGWKFSRVRLCGFHGGSCWVVT